MPTARPGWVAGGTILVLTVLADVLHDPTNDSMWRVCFLTPGFGMQNSLTFGGPMSINTTIITGYWPHHTAGRLVETLYCRQHAKDRDRFMESNIELWMLHWVEIRALAHISCISYAPRCCGWSVFPVWRGGRGRQVLIHTRRSAAIDLLLSARLVVFTIQNRVTTMLLLV